MCFASPSGERSARHVSNPVTHTLIRWIALYSPLPWPKGAQSAPELDQKQAGTPPGNFAADVQALSTLLERAASSYGGVPAHPYFGKLSSAEWGRLHYRHANHHLRQFGA